MLNGAYGAYPHGVLNAPSPWTKLAELRKAAGLPSQAALARLIVTPSRPHGVTRQHISRLESGRRGASEEVIEKLAEVLGADLTELADSAPTPAYQPRYYRARGDVA